MRDVLRIKCKSKNQKRLVDLTHVILFLRIFCVVLFVPVALFYIYQLVMMGFGLKRPEKKQINSGSKKHRFAIIIAARNEEEVIPKLIESIHNQKYPKELFDIFVVADNCTDKTAQVSRDAGACVFERFDKEWVGKGYALKYVFDILRKQYSEEYDAACVFDADNLAAPDFLITMNEYLCDGHEIIQGYRDTKNPYNNYLSGNYMIHWCFLSRFYHLPRTRLAKLGLSASVCGTGFVFKADIIKEKGWSTKTITEDCEFSLLNAAKGRRVVIAYGAKFYDEQPTEFGVSLSQRRRWIIGGYQCLYTFPQLIKGMLIKGNFFKIIDVLFGVLSGPIFAAAPLLALSSTVLMLLDPNKSLLSTLALMAAGTLAGYGIMLAQAVVVLAVEGKLSKRLWKAIITYPAFSLTFNILAVLCVFCPKIEWTPIKHTHAISLNDADLKQNDG